MDTKSTHKFSSEQVNAMVNVIYDLSSERYLEALTNVFDKAHIDGYSLLKKQEWKTCLQKDGYRWKVSFIERGDDVDPVVFDSIDDACVCLIMRVSPKGKRHHLEREYFKQVGKTQAPTPTFIQSRLSAKLV